MKRYFALALAFILTVVATYFVTDYYSSRRARGAYAAKMYNMDVINELGRVHTWNELHRFLANGCVEQAIELVKNKQHQGLLIIKGHLEHGAEIGKTLAQIYSPIIREAKATTGKYQNRAISKCNALAQIGFDKYDNKEVTNPGQLWAIKLSGIVIQINHERQNYLAPGVRTYQNQAAIHTMLVKYWGVNSRDDLLNTIKSLRTDGHAPLFMSLVKVVDKGLFAGKSIKDILAEQQGSLNQTDYNYLVYIARHIRKFEGKDLILWDWGRIISLARWGYEAGYLGELEAWSIIMPLAEQMRTSYSSWKEYGQLYSLARATWAAGFGKADQYYSETNDVVDELLAPGGAWASSPWPKAPVATLNNIVQ